MLDVSRILCADWGKLPAKRAVFEASVGDRTVRCVGEDVREVDALVRYAARGGAPVIVAFDAPIGIPASFLGAGEEFMPWLLAASLDDCTHASAWCRERPFFAVPKGKGSLRAFEAAARVHGVELKRTIERQTGGKSVFITSGLPGTVGSAARDLWRGLVRARKESVPFHVWPFEGELAELLAKGAPVVAEIYPRAAYATALRDDVPRARMAVSKTNAAVRARALDVLLATGWVRESNVTFHDVDRARDNEDDFDALVTAAALLRCVVEDLPLAGDLRAPRVEGGILGTGSVDLALREAAFR